MIRCASIYMNKFIINTLGIELDYSKKYYAISKPEKLQLLQLRAIKEHYMTHLCSNQLVSFISFFNRGKIND
jgi:hypothetical protein